MRCGVLIVGSLLWDSNPRRETWRKDRLDVDTAISVCAPFYYGRRSRTRNNTFTMTLSSGEPTSWGVLVSCKKEIDSIDDLSDEAVALWAAEDTKAHAGCISKNWGCIGAAFRSSNQTVRIASDWECIFRRAVREPPTVPALVSNGHLNIPWPTTAAGQPAHLDIILATVTVPDSTRPPPNEVADAWINSGNEDYFLNNVCNGIRTPDDKSIWLRFQECSPPWLQAEANKIIVGLAQSKLNLENQIKS